MLEMLLVSVWQLYNLIDMPGCNLVCNCNNYMRLKTLVHMLYFRTGLKQTSPVLEPKILVCCWSEKIKKPYDKNKLKLC